MECFCYVVLFVLLALCGSEVLPSGGFRRALPFGGQGAI
jgi:hypothetical protein